MSVSPYAPTERHDHNNGGATHHEGCALAHETHRIVVGDGERIGVLERLRAIEFKLLVAIAIVGVPLWLQFAISAWDRWGP